MIIDIRTLDRSGGHVSGVETVTFDDVIGGTASVRCSVEVDYHHMGGAFHFLAAVEGAFETHCHRCLDPVRQGVGGGFDLVVRLRADFEAASPGPERAEGAEDVITLSLHEHEVPLDALIRETVLVSVPMIVRCRDDCLGLCPTCGVNRNREACTCAPTAESRWDALKRLKGGSG